jgi:integration host factor subunit alpha
VEWVFEIMKETPEGGEKIKISGFGNFVVRAKRPRKGRNPKTGEEIVISG